MVQKKKVRAPGGDHDSTSQAVAVRRIPLDLCSLSQLGFASEEDVKLPQVGFARGTKGAVAVGCSVL